MAEDHLIQFIKVSATADSHIDRNALLPAGWKYGRDTRLRQLSGRRGCPEK
jgi:hypothetical protein